MTKRNLHGTTLECVQGDIARQTDMEAVVNAANAELRIGGGVVGEIHRASGPELENECRPLAPIRPGQAVITGAHNLPNHYVIHCLGPIYGVDQPSDMLLACGLDSVLDYLENLHFDEDDLAYLGSLGKFSDRFLAYLRDFRFSGTVYAVPEGTPIFANEPILEILAPLLEAQIIETFVMNQIRSLIRPDYPINYVTTASNDYSLDAVEDVCVLATVLDGCQCQRE